MFVLTRLAKKYSLLCFDTHNLFEPSLFDVFDLFTGWNPVPNRIRGANSIKKTAIDFFVHKFIKCFCRIFSSSAKIC
jgi:hypothetical protein